MSGLAPEPVIVTAEAGDRPVPRAWNRTDAPFPADRCIHQLVEDQAVRTPDAVAVVADDASLTYRELNERANRLAHALVRLGVGPEVRVGVCLQRGAELVVALLAVLKAGGAYVPLDPAYPAERLELMLADAGVWALVTQEALRRLLPVPDEVHLVSVDGVSVDGVNVDGVSVDGAPAEIREASPENPLTAVAPRNLAYLINTSGSTGVPKSVAIEHQSAVAMLAWAWSVYSAEELGGMLASTSVCFDMSVFELFAPLARGGRVIVVENALALPRSAAADQVRLVDTVPSAIATLLETGGIPAGVRTVNLGGELLKPELVDALYAQGIERVYDLYGPSEDTTFSTYALRVPGGAPTIGRPVANARCHVVDADLRPVAVGQAGELYLAGKGITRGYLGRPGLTAGRYLPDPFSGEPGARMYRTGDRVRWLADGTLEYLGRLDHQVKIRGYRVEPGEIEAVLRQHPGVHEVVVAPWQPASGDRRLAAYLVPRLAGDADAGGAEGDGRQTAELVRALKRAARDRLPEYMVPSVFVPMERFPLSPNGKVDRRALPAPPERPDDVETPLVAPRTEAEAQVAAVWAEVLGVRALGVEDDVFALGAHSLAVTQVAARLRARLGVEVPLHELFAASTAAALAAAVERRAARPPAPPGGAMLRAPREARIPLASGQERIWFLLQLARDNLSYNFQALVTFRGPLDTAVLRAALREIVRRHEVFRTTFPAENGHPYQQVHPPFEVELALIDLSALSRGERAAEEERMLREAFAEAFDLTALPLVRWFLVRRGPDEHVLVHREHHMVHDGWSFHVFLRELLALYEAFAAGRPSPLPELAWQFGDYAYAQRRWMEGDEARAQVEFWRRQLAGSPPVLTLPHDRPRPAEQRFRGASPRHELSAALYQRLREASRRTGVTLFATMMAAYDVLLWRWSGQADLNVGTGIANRRAEETHDLMGMFVNSVVVRARVEEDLSFAELARRVHAAVLAAAEHQEIRFERVVEALRPERSLGHNPVFQAMFSFHDSAIPELRLPGIEVEVTPALGNGSSKFDLDVVAIPRAEQRIGQGRAGDADGITLVWEYNTDLFDAATMEAMARQYRTLLEAVAAEPERRVGALELLDDAERRRVLEGWNPPPAAGPADRPVHRMIEARAARTPDAPALVSGGDSISCGELNRRANRLAHHLRRLGVGPDVRVGVCLERGAELPVALLAVLKAGGAYVPLDPAYPRERLAFMLADAGAAVLVTRERTRAAVEAPRSVGVVDLDAARAEIDSESAADPEGGAGPGNLAYVVYTSGSTGTPKGVGVEHRALSAYVDGAIRAYALGPADRVLQFHSVSFDPAAEEIFATLGSGGALVPLADALAEPAAFWETCRREGVTALALPTAVWHTLVPHLEAAAGALPDTLRLAVIGGERALPGAVAAWRRVAGSRVRLLNSYGPTETTIGATLWDASGDGGTEPPAVLIGRPVPGCRAYVLDEAMRPLPPGVPGELYVGGVQVARGYLGRPGATAERFVPDPFGGTAGTRLYRTGDRVRWKPDGALEYLGRLDEQVKVRGFRVEPGEVEAALRGHPGVAACAVVADDAAPGGKRLVGYVVPREAAPARVDADEIRAHLRRTLPEHMVPGALVLLDALPLTPNGKVDRAALPAPDPAPGREAWVAPRTPVEEVLAGVWAEVLGRERVGARENFFSLGGHSLLATRVVSRVRALLGAELPVRALFEASTVAELAARVEAARREGAAPLPPVVPVPRDGPLPLSFAQERLWFLDRLDPGGASYNLATALRLEGALDAGALERALGAVVRRHEALRTTFREVDGAPVQVIAPFGGFVLSVEDLSGLNEEAREAAVRRRAAEETARPFDLAAGALFRPLLLRLAADAHVLLLTMHHIVSDEWSMGVLFRELSALYAAERDGAAPAPAEPPVQYADFAAWQRERLRGAVLDDQLAWWRERLADAPALLELPTDHPRPAVRTQRGALEPFVLPAALLERLRALGRGEGATLHMVLLAAFQALLSKYGGGEDVVVGTPVAVRTRREVEGLIGFFNNTLVLRTDLSGDPGFRTLIGRVREATLGAYEHQDVPFEKLVAELQPERSRGHAPLFQVMFVLADADAAGLELPGVRVSGVAVERDTSKFDLTLFAAPHADGIRGMLEYSTDLWERATIQRMAGHLARLLEQVAEDADVRLSRIELPDAAERARVVEEWNRTDAEIPADRSIHGLFAEQAARTPHAPAVVHEAASLTYRELNERANRLAHHLMGLGVGPEVRVGLCLERSLDAVVSILAVLKAGGAYVPLDPAYPVERLEFMLGDSGAAVLVTQEKLRGLLPARAGTRVVVLEEARGATEAGPADDPAGGSGPRNLAYVIYTSGSTGVPKGVAIEHRSVAALLAWAGGVYTADELSGVLAATSFCFDLSAFELFVPLARGGTVVLVENALALPASAAADRVRLVNTVPSAIAALLKGGGIPPSVRTVNLAGEPLLAQLVDALYAQGVERVYDLYGPSEDTTYSTWTLRRPGGPVTIGRPIAGTRAYVLDGGTNPVPVGVVGELCLGGLGLARGYLGRPALTAERFVPDPFGAGPGGRLYRTGDRARWRADGTLHFLGRQDGQVKVRGFRVELGEVEAALRRYPGVADCVVVPREDAPGERRLAAYVVGPADAEALRAHLRRSLPEFMVPSAFVVLDALPLTPNGKLDRRALPAPAFAPAEARFVAPATAVEELLAGIWAEVLGQERVSVRESFFDLGGHSLLATRVASRIRAVLGVELPVRAFFETPTVAEMAGAVEALRRTGASSPAAAAPLERTRPLSFAQERLWFLDRMNPGSAAFTVTRALRLAGALDRAALERALGEIVRRHEALRTTLREADGPAVQVIAPFAGFTLPVEELPAPGGAEREAAVRRRVEAEAAAPFDLSAGPLFRARLLRLGAEDHVLLACMHHAVTDAWSLDLLVRELAALYGAYREGRPSPLPELALQYADYALWQRDQLRGEAFDRQVAWWKERLAGAPELLELPTDRPRPAVMSFRGASEPFQLSAGVHERLQALGRREGATLFMVLLGAFQALLSKYAGSGDVVVGTTIAGRTRAEVEPLIGLFMNTLVLRTDLSGDPSFREVLRRVREVTLGADEHQEVPFERLVTELRPERSLSHSPLFQVLFELHHAHEGPGAGMPGLEVRRVETEAYTAKVDLAIALTATGRGLSGELVYATDLFEPATARRMVEHWTRVLEQVADGAERRLSRLELLGEEERRAVAGWNRTAAEYPSGATIHQLFEVQAERTPDAPAVAFGGETLAYRELDERANRLARHLAALGVGPEVRVGICLERGPELMVCILGVMKAGGAYVPVDPAHPAERIGYVLADSAVAVLLTQARLREKVPVGAGVRVVCVDAEWERIAAESAAPVESGVTAENLAYVIYTSGSTGRPKGVAMHHRGVVNYLHWGVRAYGAERGNGSPVFSSMAVDLTLTNLLPLFAGRPVRLLPEENAVEALAEALRERPGFGLIKITPTHLSLLTPLLAPEEARAAAHTLVIGADFLSAEPTLFWQENAPGVRLMNEYGPTETVVGCSAYALPPGRHRAGAVPVGGPIQNLAFHLLDDGLQPVPVGLPGELYIGGAGVARGYLGRPGLTAETFVPDPFAGGGARMYRTGDRARWQADGNLMILGRRDHQVKLRGYRVELGEIEAALRRHPSVDACLVVVREDAPGEKRLVAYVVARAGAADAGELREHLRRTLPEYMVPGAFVRLDALPQTPTGKIDPRTLPPPEPGTDEARFVAPRTPTEELLAGIWCEVLRLERVGVEESFFELGGDSILSLQVAARARRAGLEISPRQVFEYQTIAELAPVADGAGAPRARRAEQGRVAGSVPLTPVQAWFFAQGHPRPQHYNQSLLLEVDAAVGDAALEAALAAVLEHHDALRLRFRRTPAGWEQWHADRVGIALERADLSALPPGARDPAQDELATRMQAGLELERGPVGRAALVDRGADGRVLLLVLHHLVVDGVSWRIVREDLEQACARLERGEPADPGAKSTSFREWAAALGAYAGSEALQAEAGHWLAQGPDGVGPLPVDGEGGRTVAGARTVVVRLDAAETRALLHEVPAAYRTQINDVLLCALADAVSAWTGSPRVRLALEGHGREEEVAAGVDLTRTVGWFTTLYPLVLDLAGAAGPGERLMRVKEQLRAVPRRGIGYGVLRWMSPDPELRRALAAHAEPEILFNYLGQFEHGLAGAERLRFARGPHGRDFDAETRLPHLLAINGEVSGGCLELRWIYAEGTHRRETVERVADAYLRSLRALIAHCRQAGTGGYTPSDFPLAALTQAQLDAATAGGRAVDDLYPLSPLQEGMLFHAASEGERQAYLVQLARRLEGSLDEERFRRAWDEVVARHPALRTSFVWRGLPRPLQRVEPAAEVPWRVEDWSGLPGPEQEAALERYLGEDRARGFVLQEAPLLRCALFRLGGGAWWFVWTLHHLLTDGWSTFRVENEALRLYRAWAAGRPVELGRARPYRDYIAWLRRQDPEQARAYWSRVLAGFSAPTPLGVDRPAGPGAGARYAQAAAVLPAARTQRLEQAARRRQVTLNTLLQGAWGLLLSRYGGSEDVVFGATVSGRPAELEGVEEMVGVFINTLPVRVRVHGGARAGAWLAGLQRAQAEAREHEHAPLVQVQGWSEVPRGTPLFESLFVFENFPAERAEGEGDGGVRVTASRVADWATYPLTLVAAPGRELWLGLRYDEDRFDAATAGRMLRHLEWVLEALAEEGDPRLAELELVGGEERRRVLFDWNRTEAAYPARACIHRLFEEQAERTPDAPAVVFGDETLTYRELDERAGRLARHLAGLGVGPEARVGIRLERGPEMVVAVLGVLKAGGAYVPLDPAHPAERLERMLADCGAAVLLARADAGEVPAGVRVVEVDAAERAPGGSAEGPSRAVPASALAYVMYTSGSTGAPKGVAVEHRGVVRLVRGANYADLGPGETVLQAAPFSFDASTLELWGALLNGGRVVLAPAGALSLEALGRTLTRHGVTTAWLTAGLFQAMVEERLDDLRGVRQLLAGGDVLPVDAVAKVRERFPGLRLINGYGPTENTTFTCCYTVPDGWSGGPVPIGTPVSNTRVYVLDAALRPAPVGVGGELYAGGDGVARGYLGRPGPTAERFVPDPFGAPGGRLYRTGDRVRWGEDGTVEFLGRVDTQAKIRGFRIEPGEIEAALRRHPGVAECAVVASGDGAGERRLVAYVVGPADADALRDHLRGTLPDYMVPSFFVPLERLPLTGNGKVDRRALPAPEAGPGEDGRVAPRTPVEEVLAELWAGVLGVARVGVSDGFFALGGESLLAMRVASRVREVFGVELPVRALFEHPTVAELAVRVEALRREERPALPPVAPAGRTGPIPLSFAQERLWFLDRLQPGGTFYNVLVPLRLRGALDVPALERALGEIVRRHEALRTTLREVDGSPVQVIAPCGGFALPVETLPAPAGEAREAAVRRRVNAEAATPFDLAAGPLFRARLLALADDDHVLPLSMHHAVTDGWSLGVFFRELAALYAAYRAGRESPLPALAVQYADHAAWQRTHLAGETLERQVAWWRDRLAGAPELLELPADRPRPAVQSYRGAREPLTVPHGVRERLEALARREGATTYMVLLGAFQVLLSRYTGADDVVVGTTIAGRTRGEVEPLIGLFMNTLVLRTDLSGDPGFREVLRRVREVTLGAYDHEHVPFERLVTELRPERSLSHSPLFQVLFELHTDEGPRAALPGLAVGEAEWESGTAKYDLSVALTATPEGLSGGLTYATDLFDAATARRMVRHLERVLEQVADDPERRLSRLDLVGDEERRMVEGWNRTAAPYPSDATIHRLFEAQAERTPDAPAVVFAGRALTYGELEARANRLARHLAGIGVGPEVRVGICLERGPELLPCILGVMKAGGAYVPVDPAHPAERIGYVLADSGVAVLLTQARLRDRAPVRAGVRVICADAEWERIAAEDATRPASAVTSENLAYVIYTSGSTGRPKGVAMHHRGVVNYIHWGIQAYGADGGNGSPVFSSMAVDLTVTNLLPLFAGRPVHLLPEENAVEALAEVLRRKPGFGLIKITPVHLALLTPLLAPEEARAAAHTLVIGADFLTAEPTVFWQDHAPGVRLMNEYGPTETVVGCSAYTLPNGVHRTGPVPVGGPIRNLAFHVLDAQLQPVPVGLPGELYIGGAGVARGYLGRPGLSAEKFVPDPFAGGGARMYRTGDRARWLAEGGLMILGRTDNQVKVRGYRVEPGEIEAVLRRDPSVDGCLVVVREDAPGDRRLVAYVVARAEAFDPGALREHLRSALPEYMVPSGFVRLDALPRTSTGKIDPKTLPAPDYEADEADFVPPRTPAEELVAAIWSEVLELERVGATDNFFERGGHSLLATLVIVRIRDVFGVAVPLRALFEGPTVAELADRVEQLRRARLPQPPPVRPADRTGALPLSFAQERLWFLDRMEPGSAVYNVPLGVRMRGALHLPALERALAEVVRRHESLRTVFREVDGAPVQVVAPFAGFALPVEELSAADGAEREGAVRRRAAEDAARPFDLAAGPLFRARLLRVEADDHVLLLALHHTVSDGLSLGVFFRELSALYAAFRDGTPSPLADLPVQYADYAAWQRAHLRGEVLEGQLAWWRERLAGAPALLELPTDRPRPPMQTFRGAQERAELPAALLERLRALGRGEGATLYMVLLGAFQVLLSRYCGTDDVVVGSPSAGRTHAEVQGLIGLFVNTLVLRGDLSGDPDFRTVLGRVREAAMGAWDHQDVPFERLVAELQPERSLSHSPLFQVTFSLEDAEMRVGLPGLRCEPVHTGPGAAKFDLALELATHPGGLRATLGYSADLFDPATVRRMLGHLERVLEQVADDPGTPLSRLELLAGEERRAVLEGWSGGTAPVPLRPVHHLFAEQALRTPDAPALAWGGGTLSYGELDAASSRLAHHLAARGAAPERIVAVSAERVPETVVAILAVLKAGAAYLPLDPEYPADRLRYMLADSGAALLVCPGAPPEPLRGAGIPTVDLRAAAGAIAACPDAAPRVPADACGLAYVIYTSGSTGRPKGVAVPHRGVSNQAWWARSRPGLGAGDRVLQFSSFSFDAAVHELFGGGLLAGATVVMAERDALAAGEPLRQTLWRERVTSAVLPPSVLAVTDPGGLPELRVVISAGEMLPAEVAARWADAVELHDAYGPTEVTIVASSARVAPGGEPPLIGRPLDNARLYVLDPGGRPVPARVPGELYVGGAGVARGYLNRPGLTAERFVPDPFGGEPGARLYRTGDRVRWTADGQLDYLGRLDGQVKVRGFRVETGEIEAALRRHPGVEDCVVIAREDVPGDRRLAAYVVGAADAEALRAHLRALLPAYMVPGPVVSLPALPLTPSGKVDRRALPDPSAAGAQGRRLPETELEAAVAGVWAQVLGVEAVGVEDNFFDLGGHSLLLVRLQARLSAELGAEVRVVDLFQYPTVRSLAGRLRDGADAGAVERGEGRGGVRQAAVDRRLEARRRRGG